MCRARNNNKLIKFFLLRLSAVFDCPFIWFSTIEPHWMITSIVDEVLHPAYNADFLNGRLPPFSFSERVHELWTLVNGLIRNYL